MDNGVVGALRQQARILSSSSQHLAKEWPFAAGRMDRVHGTLASSKCSEALCLPQAVDSRGISRRNSSFWNAGGTGAGCYIFCDAHLADLLASNRAISQSSSFLPPRGALLCRGRRSHSGRVPLWRTHLHCADGSTMTAVSIEPSL